VPGHSLLTADELQIAGKAALFSWYLYAQTEREREGGREKHTHTHTHTHTQTHTHTHTFMYVCVCVYIPQDAVLPVSPPYYLEIVGTPPPPQYQAQSFPYMSFQLLSLPSSGRVHFLSAPPCKIFSKVSALAY
jgi:hypothetical protein